MRRATVEWVGPTYRETDGAGDVREVARGDRGPVVTAAADGLVVTFPHVGAIACGRDEVRVVA